MHGEMRLTLLVVMRESEREGGQHGWMDGWKDGSWISRHLTVGTRRRSLSRFRRHDLASELLRNEPPKTVSVTDSRPQKIQYQRQTICRRTLEPLAGGHHSGVRAEPKVVETRVRVRHGCSIDSHFVRRFRYQDSGALARASVFLAPSSINTRTLPVGHAVGRSRCCSLYTLHAVRYITLGTLPTWR